VKCKNNIVSPAHHFHCILSSFKSLYSGRVYIQSGCYVCTYVYTLEKPCSWAPLFFISAILLLFLRPFFHPRPLPLPPRKSSQNSRHFICNFLFLLAFYDFFFSTSWAGQKERGIFTGFSTTPKPTLTPFEIGNICVMQFSLLAGW